MTEAPHSGGRPLLAGVVAALVHGLADLACWPSSFTRPPYLRLEDMPEVFSMLSPLGISIAFSAISGIIAALAAVAFEPTTRRRTVNLGLVLAAFWFFSAVLLQAVWLSTPWGRALPSLLLALPRGLAVAFAAGRLAAAAPAPARG